MTATDTLFAGSIPAHYDRYMVPLLFRPTRTMLAQRAASTCSRARSSKPRPAPGSSPRRCTAPCPTPKSSRPTSTRPMLDVAAERSPPAKRHVPAGRRARPAVRRRQLRPRRLPVRRHVLTPTRSKGNSEARRVLRDGGRYLLVDLGPHRPQSGLGQRSPRAPGRGSSRTIRRSSSSAGRSATTTRADRARPARRRVRPTSDRDGRGDEPGRRADEAAYGMCYGSPMRAEIAERGPDALDRAAQSAERALARFDGQDAPMSALIVTATK